MPEGKIKKVLPDKGFGFIEGETDDVFFHRSALQGMPIEELQEGELVDYGIEQDDKGPRATFVRLARSRVEEPFDEQ